MARDGSSDLSLLRRFAFGALAAVVLILVPASPASADPPVATDFRSEISEVVPTPEGVTAEIVGGDGFLMLTVDEGVEVEVPGYTGEPYLHFQADGTVLENEASPASYVNQGRTRTVDPNLTYDEDSEPRWKEVATDGRWAWHDHRIHHMGGSVPEGAKDGNSIAWTVPIVVEGDEVEIRGSYRQIASTTPIPWIILIVVVAAGAVLASTRAPALAVAGGVLLAGSVGAVIAGGAQRGISPPGAPASPLLVALPVIAVIGAVIAVLQRGKVLRAVGGLAAAAALGGWALVRIGTLWKPVLPTSLPFALDRGLTGFAIGAAIGAAVVIVRSDALAPSPDIGPEPAAEATT